MMVLNLIPVQKGGGLQNALSFVKSSDLRGVVVLIRDIQSLKEAVISSQGRVVMIKGGVVRRVVSELKLSFSFKHGTKVLTLFGPPLLGPRRYVNLVGCAYSNLFYPEIDFWAGQPKRIRMLSYFKDSYRRWALARADGWVFETGALRQRAVSLFNFPDERVHVIRMTAGWWITKKAAEHSVDRQPDDAEFRVLYLTGYHVNNRVETLIRLSELLCARGDTRVKFLVSIEPSSVEGKKLLDLARSKGVESRISLIGTISAENVPDVIFTSHAMCNLAVLESFSNNVVEAWAGRRPLIITDADWSRDACDDAALYVDPNDLNSFMTALLKVVDSPDAYQALVEAGVSRLRAYPTIAERTGQYWRCLEGTQLRSHRVKVWERGR